MDMVRSNEYFIVESKRAFEEFQMITRASYKQNIVHIPRCIFEQENSKRDPLACYCSQLAVITPVKQVCDLKLPAIILSSPLTYQSRLKLQVAKVDRKLRRRSKFKRLHELHL